eukprot:4970270-Pyramimonas_sp.AAC.1
MPYEGQRGPPRSHARPPRDPRRPPRGLQEAPRELLRGPSNDPRSSQEVSSSSLFLPLVILLVLPH